VLVSAGAAPSSDEIGRVMARAASILTSKTGESMIHDVPVAVGAGVPLSLARSYVNANAAQPPDGILVLSDDQMSTTFGGYSLAFTVPPPFVNPFPSPYAGSDKMYLAVVDFFHKYARCGYDDAGNRVSDRSSGGECRNRSGLLCVNAGRHWMCPDALNDLYADFDYNAACAVVHEFMHPFGNAGNLDHYGTQPCTSRTQMSPAAAIDVTLTQQSCGMCPDVFANFKRAR
jgi:hypothetical protein